MKRVAGFRRLDAVQPDNRRLSSMTRRSVIICILTLSLAQPISLGAQAISVNAVAISANHSLLGDPLVGAGISLRTAGPGSSRRFHLDIERVEGQAERFAVPCAGLIEPGTCAAENVRDDARLTSANAGVAVRLFGGRRVGLAFTTDLTLASVRVDTRAVASGQRLRATKGMWGGSFGAAMTATPVARMPLALELAAGIGGLLPINHVAVADGYTPFEESFGFTRARLGLVWHL